MRRFSGEFLANQLGFFCDCVISRYACLISVLGYVPI